MSPKSVSAPKQSESQARFRGCVLELSGGQREEPWSFELEFAFAVLETAQLLVLALDLEMRIRFVNPRFEELSGYSFAELEKRDWFDACLQADTVQQTRVVFDSLIAGDASGTNTNSISAKDGTIYDIEWKDLAVRDAKGRVTGIVAIGRELSSRRTADRKLEEREGQQEERVGERRSEWNQVLEGSFDASTVALAYLDPEMRFMRVNQAYASSDKKDPAFFVGKGHFDLFPHEENEKIFYSVRDTGKAYSTLAKPFEYERNPERGVTHWDWTLTPVKDHAGSVIGLVLALRDVTARIEAMEAVEASEARVQRELEVKELLLHEIHHRVKNNLQMVSSLLFLQSQKTDDKHVIEVLTESRNRVHAMSLVHEALYRSDEIDRVAFDEYLGELVSAIRSSYYGAGTEVEFEIESTAPPLSLEAAMSCGLVACELITNALKHAFKGRDKGRLHISLTPTSESHLALVVRDDGVGFIDEESPYGKSLGLTLVRTLANQLEGDLEFRFDGGTVVRLVFPNEQLLAS